MQYFDTCILFLAIIRIHKCSLTDIIPKVPLSVKQIKTKDETILKIVKDEENLDFPGQDHEKLLKIKSLWEKYYNCLNKRIEYESNRKPVIIQIMEGQYISLKCPFCQRPLHENNKLSWKYKPLNSDVHDPEEPQVLDLASQMTISQKMTLQIYNAIIGYSGLYACYYGNSPISVYILEVLGEQQMTKMNDPPSKNETIQLPGSTNLVVYYYWGKWTECSTCNAIGKKYRYGICMVKTDDAYYPSSSHDPIVRLTAKSPSGRLRNYWKKTRKREESSKTFEQSIAGLEFARRVVQKFENGIPCSSKLMPHPYKHLIRDINKTPAAAIVNYCKVSCPETGIFEIMDSNGRVLESANNTAGIYSSYQAIPKMAPEVERKTVTAEFGQDIILQCPGNLITDTPVTWMIKEQLLIPELIFNESHGRIAIDLLNRLHIKDLRQKDTDVYSCWQRDQLAGTITLNVDKKFKLSYDHHTMLLSMLIIAIMFLYIGIKVLTREIKMRKT